MSQSVVGRCRRGPGVWRHATAFVGLLIVFLLGMPSTVSAQEMRTVTGNVTRGTVDVQPFPGVRVSVKGTQIATTTDTEGFFTLGVPGNAYTLVLTYLGYKAEEVMVPATNRVEVQMSQVAIGIEGVVVTALGFEREKKSLGYAVQDIQGDVLAEVPEYNLVNALQGNVAGIHVINAGPTGGSARIVIRGASSITGQNQPLFVVDGVPLDNASRRNTGYGGIDYGNAINDIDPSNIENISILKGPTAAALYGSRASSGVIEITTKSGRGAPSAGLGMTANISYTAETILRLPDYQNEYGQGILGEYRFVDGAGAGLWDFVDESWGPKLDGRLIDQFTGAQQPWIPQPNNVRSFFETGGTLNTNVAIARSSERSHIRLSLTNSQVQGITPGNTMDRIGLALKGGATITDRITAEASLNYTDQNAENRPGTGYDEDNPMQSFIWFGRQVDMDALRNYRCTGNEPTACDPNNGQYNWNYNYHNNPFWEALVNTNNDERDRLFGRISVRYQVNNWIAATASFGRDWYRDHRKRRIAPNSLDDAGFGSFGEETIYRSQTTKDLILSGTRQLTGDVTMDLMVGVNQWKNRYEFNGVTVSRLTAPGIYTIDNAAVTPNPTDDMSRKESRSVYGSLNLNYKGFLNVELTGRNDWSSTLPEDNRTYFYPSVSSAFVFTDAFGVRSGFLSSGKVRASWTRVGTDADPYQLTSILGSQQQWGNSPMFSVANRLANFELKPEETTAWEVGTDLGFFNERMGFVLTSYNQSTSDQIMPVQVSRASGFSSRVLNAGTVRNRGVEVLFKANPIRSSGFNWDMTVNWSKNNSEVTELFGDLETLVLGDYWSMNIEARKGEPYGVMYGNGYLRDDQGRLLLTAGGMPQRDPERRILGNYNPDWNGGIANRFSFGAFDMSVLVDGQRGGDIFSVTNWFGEYAGVLQSTLRGREIDFCDPGIIVDGILPDGSANTNVSVCPEDYFGRNYGINEASIDDASYIKLREVRIGYQLPTSWVSWTGFSSGSFSLIGRNLALWSNIENIDPETAFDASNVQGIEFGQFPSVRSWGFSLSFR